METFNYSINIQIQIHTYVINTCTYKLCTLELCLTESLANSYSQVVINAAY